MTLTRWSPVSGLAALEIDRLNRMFDAALTGEPLSNGAWIPPVDILETADQAVVVKAELPEMTREAIKVSLENNVLTIEGERKLAEAGAKEHYHRVERGHGAFRRSFTVPANVDAAHVSADYRDGVLTVTLPRREEAKPRQIQIG